MNIFVIYGLRCVPRRIARERPSKPTVVVAGVSPALQERYFPRKAVKISQEADRRTRYCEAPLNAETIQRSADDREILLRRTFS
jgi:hypothetical protein